MTISRQKMDERNREICRLRVKEGLTASQIARRIGVSRNVVCGVLWREGYTIRPTKASHAQRKAVAREPKASKVDALKAARDAAVAAAKALEIEPIPLNTDTGCQWLHGDARERVMCGHATNGRSAWCPHHYNRVYQRVV